MSLLDDVKAKLAAIPAVIDSIEADQASLVQEIADLKAQIAAGTAATEADMQGLLDTATAIDDRLKAVDTAVPGASPVPVP